MDGNIHELAIYLGNEIIARLSLVDDQLHWIYTPEWMKRGYSVSPHLPLDAEIPNLNVQRFIRNLLPEGSALEELLNGFHLSRSNTFGLIQVLGLDTPGSLIMIPPKQLFPPTSFRPIEENELEQRLNKRDDFGLIFWDGKPRLSVAGVQDKINVVVSEQGQLGFGEGMLCSTHILKFEKQTIPHLVLNEYLTMRLAHQCGLNVANVSLMRYGNHPALLVERFDRRYISATEVERRHIIDGCQALNMPPDYKYERNFGSGRDVAHIRDGVSLPKLVSFANQCQTPVLAKQRIINWVLFNLLVFNSDAHGKNISFYIGANGISVAPFYDLVNIKMYPEFEHELAMGLGDEFDEQCINAYQLADFADSCQLPRRLIASRLKLMIKKLRIALNQVVLIGTSDAEQAYINQYQTLVLARCDHLFNEASSIVSIEL